MAIPLITIPLWLVVVVGSGLAVLTFRHRDKRGAYSLFGVFLGAVLWAGGYAMEFTTYEVALRQLAEANEIASATKTEMIIWHNVRITGATIVPPAMFMLALQFTGLRRLVTRRNVALLFAIPALTNLIVWTNSISWVPIGHSLWVEEFVFKNNPNLLANFVPEWGVWFWIFAFYQLGIAFCALGLFANKAISGEEKSLLNSASVFFVATLLPTMGTFFFVSGFQPVDWGPFTFVVSGLLMMVAMFLL